MKWLFLLMLATPALGQVQVNGYIKKDGTYVAPHFRTKPNTTTVDNLGSVGTITQPAVKPPVTLPVYKSRVPDSLEGLQDWLYE